MQKNYWLKRIVLGCVLVLGAGGAYYYYQHPATTQRTVTTQGHISDYNESRDSDAVVSLFEKDWYWLSARDYSEKRIRDSFRDHSPNEYEPRFFGQMSIKVLREGSYLVGFITYYMKNFYEGHILYLSVDQNFRGKRYGQQLLDTAVHDLKKMGAKIVTLAVRSTNTSALALYKRAGFIASEPGPDGFIRCTLNVE